MTAVSHASRASRTLDVLQAEVMGCFGNLNPDPAMVDAAVLLLALRDFEHKVDRLALKLHLDRDFVARCLRHLIDNGVVAGRQLVAVWADDPSAHTAALWADCRVALGQWCRLEDDRGTLLWSPAGRWHKSFDFVGVELSDCRNSYCAGESFRATAEHVAQRRLPDPAATWLGGYADGALLLGGPIPPDGDTATDRVDPPLAVARREDAEQDPGSWLSPDPFGPSPISGAASQVVWLC